MKTCQNFEALLAAFANEDLSGAQAGRVAAHVAECERCAREVETYRQLARRMRALPEPVLPEQVLREFSRAVMTQIAPPQSRRSPFVQTWIEPLFRPRWSYALATAAMIGFMLVLGLWYAPFERESPRARTLAPLLQARAWDKIYYGLLKKESRALLLHEAVPAALLKTAVAELLKKSERDQGLRAGLQRLLRAIPRLEHKPRDEAGTAKIMGVVTARGYIPAPRKLAREDDPDRLLRELQKLPNETEVTLAEIVNAKE